MLVVIYFGGCISNPIKGNPNAKFMRTEAEKMTVKIESKELKGQRSGFIVAVQEDEIYILTTPHDDLPREVKIILSDQSKVDGEIKSEIDQANDIAILAAKIKKNKKIEIPYFFPKQEFSEAEYSGNWFKLFGFKMSEFEANIHEIFFSKTGNELVFTNAPSNSQGLSGSPIFSVDNKGKKVVVIGMAKTTGTDEINAVPLDIIKNYLKSSPLGRIILKHQKQEKVPPTDFNGDYKPPTPPSPEPERELIRKIKELIRKIEFFLADNLLESNVDKKEKCAQINDSILNIHKLEKVIESENQHITGNKNVKNAVEKLVKVERLVEKLLERKRDYKDFDEKTCKKFR